MRHCRSLLLSRTRLAVLAAATLLLPVPAVRSEEPAKTASAAPTAAAKPASYPEEIAAWHQERIAGLKRPDGWLSLVGLFWLKEGENRFGSSPANTVIFPEGSTPAVAGTLERHGKAVRVHAAPGVALTHKGKPVTDLDLKPEAGPPTELALGSLRFFIIYRGDRVGVRVKDTQSPALAAFKDVDTFPVQTAWRVDARFEPYNPPKKIAIANILGQVEDQDSPGAVVFERDGRTYRLEALDGGPDGSLFFVFGDQTNGHETYGAGRFLDTTAPKDGRVVVDFNQAYNPPCAFTSFATCPLPPKPNKLAVKVEAGEKKYGEGHP
ncbi:MAG TPA: DUF1684 domain-containing protein [Thermoanaerobaculia bacterium]|nr:DUF1684 domain-containing protein [Thermoanaerobaculia bacterium]